MNLEMENTMEKEVVLELYRQMLRCREFETKLLELFSTRVMPGTMHQYNGQEAVAVGVCAQLNRDDYVTSTHRGHAHCVAKGADLNAVMAEMFAKETGCCKGFGGSMHIADFGAGMLGANGIVGGGLPMAVGAGWSSKYRKSGQVSVVFFGDGASNEGSFHESLNLAAVWKLPVIFICENNLYGFSTHYKRTMLIDDISDRAAGYGINGISVDGMDVMAVYNAAGDAVAKARNGEGPTLIECKTYRFRGHSRFEDPSYRTKEEVERWKKKDPIPKLAEQLRAEYAITEQELKQIEKDVLTELEAAVRFAENSPDPDPAKYRDCIFA